MTLLARPVRSLPRATLIPSTLVPATLLAMALVLAPAWGAAAQTWSGHAVIVGISDYPGTVNDLTWCDDDAREMRDTLLSDATHWSADNVRLLVGAEAEHDAIGTAIAEEFAEATGPEDVCLFFFSGHGTDVPDAGGGAGDEAAGDVYDEALVAHDALITDDELATWFWDHDGKRICAIFDICRAGGMAKSIDPGTDLWTTGFASEVLKALSSPTAAPATTSSTRDVQDTGQAGLVMLMACEDVQLSEEDPILRNGVFSFYVIEALSRRAADTDASGLVSAEEVFAYAFPLVVAWNPDQTPEIYDTDSAWEMDIMAAADRPQEPVVTEKEFPFGGGGCSPGGAGGGGPAVALAALGLLALLLRGRRERSRVARARRRSGRGGVRPWSGARRGAPTVAAAALLATALATGCAGRVVSDTGTAGRFGVRAGVISPFSENTAPYSAGAQAGLTYRGPLPWGGLQFDVGGDVYLIEGDGYDVEATILCLRTDAVVSSDDAARPWTVYVSAGPRAYYGAVNTYWGSGLEGAYGIGLAAGVRRPERGPDVRATVDWLPGSGNIGGFFGLTAGWNF